jgi:hypothetical protein
MPSSPFPGRRRHRQGGVRDLVVAAVFKTDEADHVGLAGSIPVHLREISGLLSEQAAGR